MVQQAEPKRASFKNGGVSASLGERPARIASAAGGDGMAKIVVCAISGLIAVFGLFQVDFPTLGRHVAEQADASDRAPPPVDMAALFRLGHH
jgi:hypothetical protein